MKHNGNGKKLKSFKDLLVWKKAHCLSIDVAKLIKNFPKDEKYDLADQMRRAARSVAANISEGFGRYHFSDKLVFYTRSRASLSEVKNHFEEAVANEYITKAVNSSLTKKANETNFLLNRLISNIRKAKTSYDK